MGKKVSFLDNGLCVATDSVPGAHSVYAGLWLPIGSAAEGRGNSGLAHFYEHLVFKGTRSRSGFQIAKEIEDLGGNINAYTSREATCFYISIAAEHLRSAVSVLADLAMEPRMSAGDFEKEKGVILEEIRAAEDNPEELADDFFSKNHFRGCGFELPIAGTIASVKALGLSELRKRQKFVLEECPIFLCVAGAAEHGRLLGICERAFARKTGGAAMPRFACAASGGAALLEKHVQQATVLWGASCFGLGEKELRALRIFNHAFGYGFTSRLFQNIREKRGLAYSINSSFDASVQRADGGKSSALFQIFFAAEPKNLEMVSDLIRKEMRKFLSSGFSKDELERAKQSIIGSSRLSRDNLGSRQSRLARQIIMRGRALSSRRNEEEISRMDAGFIEACAKRLAENPSWTFAAIAPKKTSLKTGGCII